MVGLVPSMPLALPAFDHGLAHSAEAVAPAMVRAGSVSFAVCLVLAVLLVNFIYSKKGIMVVVRISLYILSLTTIKLAVRSVVSTYDFPYPKFLNTTHFACSGVLAWAYLLLRARTSETAFRPIPLQTFFTMVLPISAAFSVSTCFNNEAISVSSANFVEMAGTAGPLCTAFVALALDQPLHRSLLFPLLVVTVGLIVCVSGDVQYSNLAFFLVAFANVSRSVKAILQQVLVKGRRGPSAQDAPTLLEPIELLAWMSIPACLAAFAWSCKAEGLAPYIRLGEGDATECKWAILLTCAQAAVLNTLSIWAVKDLGAVGAQLAANLKGVVALLGGVTMLGEHLERSQVAGYTLVLAGICWYSHAEHALDAQKGSSTGGRPNETTALLPQGVSRESAQAEHITEKAEQPEYSNTEGAACVLNGKNAEVAAVV